MIDLVETEDCRSNLVVGLSNIFARAFVWRLTSECIRKVLRTCSVHGATVNIFYSSQCHDRVPLFCMMRACFEVADAPVRHGNNSTGTTLGRIPVPTSITSRISDGNCLNRSGSVRSTTVGWSSNPFRHR